VSSRDVENALPSSGVARRGPDGRWRWTHGGAGHRTNMTQIVISVNTGNRPRRPSVRPMLLVPHLP
jgi:hypothetical protein